MAIITQKITDNFFATGQIAESDLVQIKELGFLSIINNRPDKEVAGQPSQESLKQTIEELGLKYAYLPIASPSGFSEDTLAAARAIYQDLPTPMLGFCGTGMRAKNLFNAATNPVQSRPCKFSNLGMPERIIRIIVGLALIGASLSGFIGVWGWIGLVPLVTGIFRFCPGYWLLKCKTS